MDRFINVKHTMDRRGNPLAVIENMPGEGAEFHAGTLRRFARCLLEIADRCEWIGALAYPENATYSLETIGRTSPFELYRKEICGGYSTAQRLAALVRHLYNGSDHSVRLDNLLSSADERHTRIALELMTWYAEHGENCPVFMALARELVEQECAAAASTDANPDA